MYECNYINYAPSLVRVLKRSISCLLCDIRGINVRLLMLPWI